MGENVVDAGTPCLSRIVLSGAHFFALRRPRFTCVLQFR